jgi:hypothetical protein
MHFQLFHFADRAIEVVNENNFNGGHDNSFGKFAAIVHNLQRVDGGNSAHSVR